MKTAGAHHFDPVRFTYISSLLVRGSNHRESVAQKLEEQARVALDAYEKDLALAVKEADGIASNIAETNPELSAVAKSHVTQYKFGALKKLLRSLPPNEETDSVASLTARIIAGQAEPDSDNLQTQAFENFLRTQESEVLGALATGENDSPGAVAVNLGELKSVRRFRESKAKLDADRLVTRAIEECPENAGPLNPQKLVIRSLSAMRTLSPHYLNRFVSYIDTLLWLEQVDDRRER